MIPSINAAADKAGRDAPRVIAGLPVCVTDDKDSGRASASPRRSRSIRRLPSYKAMLDKEGVANPADIGLIGSEDEVLTGVERLAKVGVTDFAARRCPANADERARTRAALVAALTRLTSGRSSRRRRAASRR